MIRLVVTFLAGLLVFSAVFLLLDYAVMSAQGLSLIFHG